MIPCLRTVSLWPAIWRQDDAMAAWLGDGFSKAKTKNNVKVPLLSLGMVLGDHIVLRYVSLFFFFFFGGGGLKKKTKIGVLKPVCQ